jgi:hypothetical protein
MADTMTIYQYDEFGYFTGETITQSVMGGIPARWTDVPPPALTEGEYAVFDNVQWHIATQLPQISEAAPVEIIAPTDPVISEAPTVM